MLNQVGTPQNTKRISLPHVSIQIDSEVTSERQSHFWYGGEKATIEAGGYKFHIEALGDVYAQLFKRSESEPPQWEDCLETIRDKSNHGVFGETLMSYLQTDQELEQLINDEHPTYHLVLDTNNWWECFVTDANGVWHDLMWNLDASSLNEAIEEVLSALKDGLEVNGVVLQLKA